MWTAFLLGLGHLLSVFFDISHNYGLAIIMLTVTLRIILMPLAIKQIKGMEQQQKQQAAMRKMQPELKKIKEKYKDDRAKMLEEQKRLHDEHGVNALTSLGGCLPMLLQFPILIAMYRMLLGCGKVLKKGSKACAAGYLGVKYLPVASALRRTIIAGKATFLTLKLGSTPSQIYKSQGLGPAIPYYTLVVLMGVTMWYQQRQMTKVTAVDPQMAQTQKFMAFLPLMFTFFFLRYPVGMTLYWVVTNIWTVGQQAILLKKFGPPPPEVAATGPNGKGASPNGSAKKIDPKMLDDAGRKSAVSKDQRKKPKGSGARKKRSGKR
ncbi:MAG: YidC/Oxa1 family membrane protein insertase [Actinomycetota bacterium]|nr:YidC/Oxa1 family membrane protein insertase [Actinomycetota bacterium]